MTIGVGVLATEPEARARDLIPSHVILMADTMGSFGDDYSHSRLHKLFLYPANALYATAANQIDKAASLLPMIDTHMSAVPLINRTYGDIVRAISLACFLHKVSTFTLEVLPKHGIPPKEFDLNGVPNLNVLAKLKDEWDGFDIGCDVLIGAFDHRG